MNTFEKLVAFVVLLSIDLGWIFLVSLLLAWPVQILWNGIFPDLFGFKIIGFWQAWKLLILTGLLFRSSSSNKKDEN